MKRGAFKSLPGQEPPQPFLGSVIDLSPPTPPERRRIVTPEEAAARPVALTVGAPGGDLFQRSAQAELRQICIRPKETTLRFGRFGIVKLWKIQFVGEARVWTKPDGSIDVQGVGSLQRMRSTGWTRICWYLVGAPIFNTRLLWLWLRGRLVTQGAVVTE